MGSFGWSLSVSRSPFDCHYRFRVELSRARCRGCSAASELRPLGRTPEGWSRGDTPGSGSQGLYWCPNCDERVKLAAQFRACWDRRHSSNRIVLRRIIAALREVSR